MCYWASLCVEDTFLMLDALEQDVEELKLKKPLLCLEIGILHPVVCVATDLNPAATLATIRTGERNLASVDCLLTSLSNGIQSRSLFDIIVFNPPYVPTEELCEMAARPTHENIHGCEPEDLLEAAWAGGADGRYWIDKVLPSIDGLLSKQGTFYMIALQANKPEELMAWARRDWDLESKIALKRKAGIEDLVVLKFWRS
ncbi:hypothetical protein PSACC_01987 [Paramicrosporidium saccamoebae]|uniref:Methylase n=1 Tax=Paramicrosporidium saccamoebae TaxID=1246581 RepID=A0A2H9TKE3_9FUNG|nr:hypothetical protein PSACC_01987 [Paramicrosporidium saccamoebae]